MLRCAPLTVRSLDSNPASSRLARGGARAGAGAARRHPGALRSMRRLAPTGSPGEQQCRFAFIMPPKRTQDVCQNEGVTLGRRYSGGGAFQRGGVINPQFV